MKAITIDLILLDYRPYRWCHIFPNFMNDHKKCNETEQRQSHLAYKMNKIIELKI